MFPGRYMAIVRQVLHPFRCVTCSARDKTLHQVQGMVILGRMKTIGRLLF